MSDHISHDFPPHIARPKPSEELVGPVVWFRGQQVAVTKSPPTSTTDPRYDACTDHHLACDCREAHFQERMDDWRYDLKQTEQDILREIDGHPTWVRVGGGRRTDLECQCLGCRLARRHLHQHSAATRDNVRRVQRHEVPTEHVPF